MYTKCMNTDHWLASGTMSSTTTYTIAPAANDSAYGSKGSATYACVCALLFTYTVYICRLYTYLGKSAGILQYTMCIMKDTLSKLTAATYVCLCLLV